MGTWLIFQGQAEVTNADKLYLLIGLWMQRRKRSRK